MAFSALDRRGELGDDYMSEGETSVSSAPVWVGAIVGALAGLLGGLFNGIVALALGTAVGYLVYARRVGRAESATLKRRVDDLLERVALVEYTVRRLDAAQSGSAPASSIDEASDAVADRVVDLAAPAPTEALAPVEPFAAPSSIVAAQPEDPSISPSADEAESDWQALERARAEPAEPNVFERAAQAAKAWLLGGNTVARVGLLVLFIGVAFLLQYLAAHTRIPIELRLAGVALGALVLLVLGWRLRERRFGYAITLQGGAVGIIYLTVFAALRLYGVLTPVPAFGLLAAIAAAAAALSIVQNARALASLAAAGGFLAPILVSTGSGRIELLLAYYLLLNLGVLGIAWFRAWRELNWIGFAFTFGVFGAWAFERYTPSHYLIAQIFLAAFWLLYLGVSLLYALRQTAFTRGVFDTTLMFALPLAAFGIQTRLTSGVQLALAAVIAAAAYLASSATLLARREAALAVLTEASFGVGVAFLTLAVPLAASAEWTAAAWALEGVALLWVGLRQRRWLPLVAGLALHAAGFIALLHAVRVGSASFTPQWSGVTVNLVVFVVTAFGSAWLMQRVVNERSEFGEHADWLTDNLPFALRLVAWAWVATLIWQPLAHPWYAFAWCAVALGLLAFERNSERPFTPEWIAGIAFVAVAWVATEVRAVDGDRLVGLINMTTLLRLAVAATSVTGALLALRGPPARRVAAAGLLVLGVLAWLIALFAETLARIDDRMAVAQVALLIVIATTFVLAWLGQRLAWDWPIRLSWTQFGAHAAFAALVVALAIGEPSLPSRHFGWFVWPLAWAAYYARLRWDDSLPAKLAQSGPVHVAGLWLLTAMICAEAALRLDAIAGDGWFFAAWGALPAAALWFVVTRALAWPMRSAPFAYAKLGAPGLAIVLLGWVLLSSIATAGDAAPLSYLPLLNPLDVATLAALGAVLRWHLADQRAGWHARARELLGAAAFVGLNAAALRAVHALAGVPWDVSALGRSLIVQSVLSLLWTVTAMVLMVIAHRRGTRPLWLVGAALLGLVVLKLFFVDLASQGTIEQIVSFVGVGVLILAIGYLAPVPPAAIAERSPA